MDIISTLTNHLQWVEIYLSRTNSAIEQLVEALNCLDKEMINFQLVINQLVLNPKSKKGNK